MKFQTVYLLGSSLCAVSSFSLLPSSTGTVTNRGIIFNKTPKSKSLIFSTSSSSNEALSSPPPTPVEKVVVLKDSDAVGEKIRDIVSQAAMQAIQERGHFALAIPGGSILKMLAGDIVNKDQWTSKTTIAYVNHKCVSMDDGKLATHAKARKLFLDEWDGVNVILMNDSRDGDKEAKEYEEKLRSLGESVLPRSFDSRLPIFDLALIGVGGECSVKMQCDAMQCDVMRVSLCILNVECMINRHPSLTL